MQPKFRVNIFRDPLSQFGSCMNFENEDRFNDYLMTLEGEYDLSIAKPTKQRSNPQNRYLHGVIIKLLSDELGYTPAEMKEVLRNKFFYKMVIIGNEEIKVLLSTGIYTTVELEEKMSQIRTWASVDLSIYIPLPNEVDY